MPQITGAVGAVLAVLGVDYQISQSNHKIYIARSKTDTVKLNLPRLARKKQVVQLWQRDRAKLDTFSINVQRYSHKISFLGHPMCASGAI